MNVGNRPAKPQKMSKKVFNVMAWEESQQRRSYTNLQCSPSRHPASECGPCILVTYSLVGPAFEVAAELRQQDPNRTTKSSGPQFTAWKCESG
jgi:hypothetical protein